MKPGDQSKPGTPHAMCKLEAASAGRSESTPQPNDRVQMLGDLSVEELLTRAREGVERYLNNALKSELLDSQLCREAAQAILPNLEDWLRSPRLDLISPNAKRGIALAIAAGDWEGIVNAFRRNVSFGTGGIRGLMAFDRESIVEIQEQGIDAPILKGPNTLNNVVLLRVSAGVAKFGLDKEFSRIVLGYDSRVRGRDFAHLIAELFLAYGFTVLIFDEPVPYPEVSFAIPYEEVRADLGILITASHNDFRYNGYKLCCANGSQFDPEERDEMYERYITKATFEDIKLCSMHDAPQGRLHFLGGAQKLSDVDYIGRPLLNIHDRYRDHIRGFLVDAELLRRRNRSADETVAIGYCAFHGAGKKAVPRLLDDLGFSVVRPITTNGLNDYDGLFPSFGSEPGKEQQPDPGAPQAAKIALEAYEDEYGPALADTDIIIGTDPDADRCGVIVRVPSQQRSLYNGEEFVLLPGDDMWALILWFRLYSETQKHGKVVDPEKKFIVQSVTTTDSIVRLARKHRLGVVKSWVGFANLTAAASMIWEQQDLPDLKEGRAQPRDRLCHPFVWEFEAMDSRRRQFNYAAMEQSNGFSILGGPPRDERSLGTGGHVRDKDGILAAILIAEIASHAKANGTTLFEMVDRQIYLDPEIGLFVNRYEPDPIDGEYPGIQGDRKKMDILGSAFALLHAAKDGNLMIGPFPVAHAAVYRTGKYDHIYSPTSDFQFPDEGIRFYFDRTRLNYVLIRPSGTSNSLRFHVQLHADVTEDTLLEQKTKLRSESIDVLDDLRARLGAPRAS